MPAPLAALVAALPHFDAVSLLVGAGLAMLAGVILDYWRGR